MNPNFFKNIIILLSLIFFTTSCFKNLPGGDALKNPPNPKKRVAKNLEEGKGFRLSDSMKKGVGGTNYEFASSNELWRASLDVIDFMPLTSANYSGGILITDWYTDSKSPNESIKIIIRFLTNEVRSDALSIKIFYKSCNSDNNCKVTEKESSLKNEIRKEILKKATLYKNDKQNNVKPYVYPKNSQE
tara:strand:- start:1389 stop:1952 length:564 start_codon:yes stop_codon:yes gene_type:complete